MLDMQRAEEGADTNTSTTGPVVGVHKGSSSSPS